MKTFATVLLLSCAIGACSKDATTDTTQTTSAGPAAPDNTKTNARDRGASVTPLDQGNNAADLNVTQAIRKALMADDSLSGNAKNVKVITNNGVVTLRGPVKSDAEKKSVESKAFAAAGSNRVDDQIDIQSN
jgi:hyperosmotically inducible periplasmic protein